MKTLIAFFLVLGTLGAGAFYYTKRIAADPPPSYRTAMVKRADLYSTISATGTVEPEEVVDVGAQVAGKINSLGRAPTDAKQGPGNTAPSGSTKWIDYGSVVQEGTVLAEIDDSVYRAQVDQAKASVARSQADLLQSQAKLDQAKADMARAATLLPSKAIAQADYDLAVANYKTAKANVSVSEAAIVQAEAMLRLAQTNLDYTVIKSPVKGVIIDRRVNIGQTVVASLNAPSLFLIAKDLKRLQVWASVNEADIGRIHAGQPVRFTVDAYPGETFLGEVMQIRLNATMTQNVVTYTVVVTTDNSSGKLLPYLTSNLKFELDHRDNVLQVPNMALRWQPVSAGGRKGATGGAPTGATATADKSPGDAAAAGDGQKPGGRSGRGQGSKKSAKSDPEQPTRDRVWVLDSPTGKARPVDVQLGLSDGTNTEVTGGDLQEGMEVVTGEARADREEVATSNPFAPKLFRGSANPGAAPGGGGGQGGGRPRSQ